MGKSKAIERPPEHEAHEAVRTLIRWAGDDPDRPGMRKTPERVLAFYRDFFAGYNARPEDYGTSVAEGAEGGNFILVRDIALISFCEHHMLPAHGTAHIAYIPGETVPGIGAVARLAADCAARLTTQESLTAAIAAMMDRAFAPRGAAVAVTLSHGCMTLRNPAQRETCVATVAFTGDFGRDADLRHTFLSMTASGREEG